MKRISRTPAKRSAKKARKGTTRSGARSPGEQRLVTAILNAAKDLLVMVLDREGRILQFNRTCQDLTGYSLEEVKGRRPWEFLPVPEDRASVKIRFEEALKGRAMQGETHLLTKRGQRRLIAWSTVSVNDGRTVNYVIRTGVDVTEREDAQAQARDSNAACASIPKRTAGLDGSPSWRSRSRQQGASSGTARRSQSETGRIGHGGLDPTPALCQLARVALRARPRSQRSNQRAWRKMFTQCPAGSIPPSWMSSAWKPH